MCRKHDFKDLPAKAETVALYLVICTSDANVGKSKINHFYAINWTHIVANRMNTCLDPWLKLCVSGCMRKVYKPVCKKISKHLI